MPRIRTIKPSFWSDPDITNLSWDARLLLVGLISLADDRGRFIATHSSVCGYVFPHEDVAPARARPKHEDCRASACSCECHEKRER